MTKTNIAMELTYHEHPTKEDLLELQELIQENLKSFNSFPLIARVFFMCEKSCYNK